MIEYLERILPNVSKKEVCVALLEPHMYPAIEELRSGLGHRLGKYEFDSDVFFQAHNAYGSQKKMASIVDELIDEDVDAIVSIGQEFTMLARTAFAQINRRVPQVFVNVPHPDRLGLINSFSHPQAHISGVNAFEYRYAERFETLLSLLPHARTILFVFNPNESEFIKEHYRDAKRYLIQRSLHALPHTINSSTNIAHELSNSIAHYQPDMLFTMHDTTVMAGMREIAQVASEMKVPLVTSDAESVVLGAAFSFGNDSYELGTEVGMRVAEVLNRGDAAGDLPIHLYHHAYRLRVNRLALMQQGVQLSLKAKRWIEQNAEFSL